MRRTERDRPHRPTVDSVSWRHNETFERVGPPGTCTTSRSSSSPTTTAHGSGLPVEYLRARASVELDVVVVDNGSDGAAELVEREFPNVRALRVENKGFGNANNEALRTANARYVLFLNPDTEVVRGSSPSSSRRWTLVPESGLAGVVQVAADGRFQPSIRRFPNALRALGEALGAERLPFSAWLGERELDTRAYDREVECDWTSGSFLLARREALESAGSFDERFFVFGEEPDLCLRIKRAGWSVRHLPVMTIIHHAERAGMDARLEAQNAYARLLHAQKHFSPSHRGCSWPRYSLRYALRAVAPDARCSRPPRRRASARSERCSSSSRRRSSARVRPPRSLSSIEQVAEELGEQARLRRPLETRDDLATRLGRGSAASPPFELLGEDRRHRCPRPAGGR